MKKRMRRNLTIISAVVVVIVLIISGWVIYQNSLNNRIIDVIIEVEKFNYSVNDTITFTLTLEDTSIPFSIEELAEGAGFCICRIPDDVNPYQIINNYTYLDSLCTYPIKKLGISDYSERDETFTLTWNGTYCMNYNRLAADAVGDVYYLAPSGYYTMFRSSLQSSSNDNKLRFNLDVKSVFYLSGLTPSLSLEYLNETSYVDFQLSVDSESYQNDTLIRVQIALYETNDTIEELVFYNQTNVNWNGSFSVNYKKVVTFNEGDWIRAYVIVTTPQGQYSIYWAEYHEVYNE